MVKVNPDGPPATLFYHAWYRDPIQYPEGVADMAGYWAENRVLGGVVLFDREEARKIGAGPDAVYIHPDRDKDWPGTGSPSTVSKVGTRPLPITPDETNTHRVDPEEPFWYTGVYRDQ
ncbi:hypothetical protein F5883DRAFT_644528 [Diaporthe sp. PMI_573]|nr:hypothetical protein F5883DRAFT_644528 [Diaporthaceae sp. PMI_573]